MQTTPRSARTSTPTQFSATFENQASGTIYNTKYMLAVWKKHNALKYSLLSIPHKVMISVLLWIAYNSTFSENVCTNAVFSYLWKPRFWHHYNTKYMFAIGKKTQCVEMQLIEYSAQSNDLAAPLKCRQLHIQLEHQRQRSFQLPWKTKVLALFTTLSTC